MPDKSIDEAFREALVEQRRGPVGTALQDIYRAKHPEPATVRATTFWGRSMQVVVPELVSCELHRYGLIEPGLTALFLDVIRAGWTVLDVGAHFGYYSMLSEDLGAVVHAFEPSTETRPSLEQNVGPGTRIVPQGVWHTETTLELQDFGGSHSAVNTFVSSRDEDLDDPDETYPVQVTSIDRYVKDAGAQPSLIKVDAEGAELSVLEGAVETIRSGRPLITIEVGDTEGENHSRKTLEFALGLGYQLFDITPEGRRPHALRDAYPYGNILLAPPGFEED